MPRWLTGAAVVLMSFICGVAGANAFQRDVKTCSFVSTAQLEHIFHFKHAKLHQERFPQTLAASISTCDLTLWNKGTYAQYQKSPIGNVAAGSLLTGVIYAHNELGDPGSFTDSIASLEQSLSHGKRFSLRGFGADGAAGDLVPGPSHTVVEGSAAWWHLADEAYIEVEITGAPKYPIATQIGKLGAIVVPRYFG